MWIFPSREIHLVRNAQPNTVALRIFVQDPPNRRGKWTDASTSTHSVAFNPVMAPGTPPSMPTLNGTAGAAPTTVVVTPSDVGQWIVDVEWTFHDLSDPTNPFDRVEHGLMRVTVHDEIAALFSGDRLISMWSGESDRQLTVYARFTDHSFEDITAHPYLKYRVDPPTLATIDPVEGRITALTAGIGTVFVSTWDDRFEFRVGLAVAPPLNAGGVPATVEQLRKRTPKHRSTLWVLAEGYQDRARFLKHAHQAIDECLRTCPRRRHVKAVGPARRSCHRETRMRAIDSVQRVLDAGLLLLHLDLGRSADLDDGDAPTSFAPRPQRENESPDTHEASWLAVSQHGGQTVIKEAACAQTGYAPPRLQALADSGSLFPDAVRLKLY